jgi:hypothetical protein
VTCLSPGVGFLKLALAFINSKYHGTRLKSLDTSITLNGRAEVSTGTHSGAVYAIITTPVPGSNVGHFPVTFLILKFRRIFFELEIPTISAIVCDLLCYNYSL